MRQRLTATAAAIGILASAACSGHGSGTTPQVSGASPYTGSPALADFDWGKDQLQGAMLLGPTTAGHMQVTAVVKQQNAPGLIQYAQQVSDPGSALYRHFLTPAQIGSRFGATREDYQKAANYFISKGLTVAGWRQHLALSVAGPQQAMERAFGTRFGLYEKNGFQFVAPMSAPHFSTVVPVTAVSNLVRLNTMHRYLIKLPPRANAADNIGYSPQQLRNAFDFTGAYGSGFTGAGITVGIIGTGPINVNRAASLCPATERDLAALKALYNVNVANVCEVDVTPSGVAAGLNVSGIPTAAPATPNPNGTPVPNPGQSPTSMFPFSGNFRTPPPVTGPCSGSLPACNPEDGEAQLDVQQPAVLAPGATVNFYLAYNANDCYVFFPNSCTPAPASTPAHSNYGEPQIGIVEADPEIQQAIADNVADVVSISYGGGETQQIGGGFNSNGVGFQPQEFAALAAEGIAVFVASGDNGTAECLGGVAGYLPQVCVSWPAGDKNVASVGGVNAPINEFGQISANITAWGNTNGGFAAPGTTRPGSGSGGGTSTIFTAPTWQQSAIGATMREQPDVSMIGDPMTGVTFVVNTGFSGGGTGDVGGTSVAAPQMAAMWALVLQACKATPACNTGPAGHTYRLGNAAPYLYSIFHGSGLVPSASFAPKLPYAKVFYDVVYGENAVNNPKGGTATPVPGQLAKPGYDQTTGVGVPFAGHLIQAITGVSVP
jgi:subtilase family serine protease